MTLLPRKIPKSPKRATRWRSQAHCNFVRGHACCVCGTDHGIELAHVRQGSGAGMGQKPDDWRTVSLCTNCHKNQHAVGEGTFWGAFGVNVEALIDAFCDASPKRAEIRKVREERDGTPYS